MIRDKIVFSVSGKLQELLLRETNLDLNKAVETCRAFEITSRNKKEMSASSEAQKTDKVGVQSKLKQKCAVKSQQKYIPHMLKQCKSHKAVKIKCPAWGKTCKHYKCKNVHSLNVDGDSTNSDKQWLATVVTDKNKRVTALMQVNGCDVRFQLDSGAGINTMCQKFVKKSQVKPTTKKRIMWNKSKLTLLRENTLEVLNPKNAQVRETDFIIVPNDFSCLLGLKTVQEMGLFTINDDNFIAQVSFDTSLLGDLGEAQLHVNPDVPPRALPCRKLPLALREDVKHELERLVEIGVLIPLEEPTVWVSQMAVVKKSDGSQRICIDPQPLSDALQREHYRLPNLDDVLPNLNNAKVFSKLNVKQAYWHL